jgi:hypothetical protein
MKELIEAKDECKRTIKKDSLAEEAPKFEPFLS